MSHKLSSLIPTDKPHPVCSLCGIHGGGPLEKTPDNHYRHAYGCPGKLCPISDTRTICADPCDKCEVGKKTGGRK